jgi:hypothetical protein
MRFMVHSPCNDLQATTTVARRVFTDDAAGFDVARQPWRANDHQG